MDLILCHVNADFDCLSSMLGAKKIYHTAWVAFPGSQEKKVRDFLSIYSPFEIKKLKEIDLDRVSRLILVDTKQAERLGPLADFVRAKRPRIHIYDHHPFSPEDLRGELEVVEEVGATATIFVEILKERKIPITPEEATVLCLGIYEETGSLRFPSTTERDLMAVAYLLRRGADLRVVSRFIRLEMSREELELLNELMKSSRDLDLYGLRIRTVKASHEEYLGDAAYIAHRIMEMEDIDALFMLLRMEGKILIVGRSRAPEVDVARVLENFNGGGHPVAASATVKGESLEAVEDRLIRLIKEGVRPEKLARDIMTSPVITIEHDTSVKEAEVLMTRYGVNVLPVLKRGLYFGLVSREVVEKAIMHGFGKSRVEEFATTDAETTTKDRPVSEIEQVMIEKNQRFMPVLEDGRVVGAITRTDLLRSIYEETLRRRRISETEREEKPSIGRNIKRLIEERFPEEVNHLLKRAGEVAERLSYRAYLVGGSVRDLLRGERNLDIDIVVEGDGIEFAKTLSGEFPGSRLLTHRRFNTAKLRVNSLNVDIATARTEYYEKPATLPKVEVSSIKKDLYRRDFTINTLAVCLNPDRFGQLIDYFGAQRDLKEKTIRVLHNLSFVEDPTRAFRAVRFAQRFGFRISKHTEKLMKSALKLNLFEKLTGTRIYDELTLTFNETDPVASLKSLSDYGLLSVIHPGLRFTDELKERLNAIQEALIWFDLLFLEERVNRSKVFIMGLLSVLTSEERKQALKRLNTPEEEAKKILKAMDETLWAIRQLRPDDPVSVYHTLKGLGIETLLFIMAVSGKRIIQKAISEYLLKLRHIRPQIRGGDLKRMGIPPGPIYSEILEALLNERLRGRLRTKEEEFEFVKNFLEGYGKDLSRVSKKIPS
ncbi:MAG: CBS domain-containing protein [Nitrospirae bacterium]|nr:MAG: CBS domain-containing protein [Nitrospirota bacterium]